MSGRSCLAFERRCHVVIHRDLLVEELLVSLLDRFKGRQDVVKMLGDQVNVLLDPLYLIESPMAGIRCLRLAHSNSLHESLKSRTDLIKHALELVDILHLLPVFEDFVDLP